MASYPNDKDMITNDELMDLNSSDATGRQDDAFNSVPLAEKENNLTSTTKANRIKSPDPFPAVTTVTNFTVLHSQPDEKEFLDEKIISAKTLPSRDQMYTSYRKFNPGQFKENSPLWQMALLRYLLDLKRHGHKIKEVSVNKVSWKNLFG